MADFYPQTLVDYAQILGALATSAAVIVSLYLSNKKPKLRVTCDVRSILWSGQDASQRPRYLSISAVNIGEFQATITGVGWTTGRFTRRAICVQLSEPLTKSVWGKTSLSVLLRAKQCFASVCHVQNFQVFVFESKSDAQIVLNFVL
jgi:hypothetical protein